MTGYDRSAERIAKELQQIGQLRDDQIPGMIGAGIIFALLAIAAAINNK